MLSWRPPRRNGAQPFRILKACFEPASSAHPGQLMRPQRNLGDAQERLAGLVGGSLSHSVVLVALSLSLFRPADDLEKADVLPGMPMRGWVGLWTRCNPVPGCCDRHEAYRP